MSTELSLQANYPSHAEAITAVEEQGFLEINHNCFFRPQNQLVRIFTELFDVDSFCENLQKAKEIGLITAPSFIKRFDVSVPGNVDLRFVEMSTKLLEDSVLKPFELRLDRLTKKQSAVLLSDYLKLRDAGLFNPRLVHRFQYSWLLKPDTEKIVSIDWFELREFKGNFQEEEKIREELSRMIGNRPPPTPCRW